MTCKKPLSFTHALPLLCLASLSSPFIAAHAQTATAAPAAAPAEVGPLLKKSVELNVNAQNLTNGFGQWRDVTLRGTVALPSHVLQAELSAQDRFNQRGTYLGISDTYSINDDWYASLALGAGDGAFYLPRYRVDAAIYRKWLPDRSLVTSVGAGYYSAPDGHSDNSISLGAIYYFKAPWVVEGGVRFNSSNPGAIRTHQQFVAATWGRDKQDTVSARYGWGGEGYQTVASNTQLVNFQSNETSLTWRHWLTPRGGVLIGASDYRNPSYTRSGINAGLFTEF